LLDLSLKRNEILAAHYGTVAVSFYILTVSSTFFRLTQTTLQVYSEQNQPPGIHKFKL
jgi:hypothetical protein